MKGTKMDDDVKANLRTDMERAHELLEEIMELTNAWRLSPSRREPKGSAASKAATNGSPTGPQTLSWKVKTDGES